MGEPVISPMDSWCLLCTELGGAGGWPSTTVWATALSVAIRQLLQLWAGRSVFECDRCNGRRVDTSIWNRGDSRHCWTEQHSV